MCQMPILLPIPVKMVCSDEAVDNQILNGVFTVNFDSSLHKEGYKLKITSQGINIIAADDAGAFYAIQTLNQLKKQYTNSACPALEIEDYPLLAMRGVSLDVSRDRIPFFEDLLKFIDLLASWKINTFTLYFEHVFAYKKHEKVWKNASPFTAQDIQKLDQYCKERFIELIPCQETLGHLSRWLCHEPYRQLAECPEGCPSSWQLKETDPFSLCPTDPRSLELMEELLDELLPNFTSQYFFCGGDETSDIGQGRSKEICEKDGLNNVYGRYFHEIGKMAAKNGKKIMIYSDMVKNNQDALKFLPKDVILAEWGYGRNYPFKENAKDFIDCGLKFCFLSSNSNYSTWGGRTYRWRGNIANAVRSAAELNAMGCFVYEFGDFGHWTNFTFSYPGFAYLAALSWNLSGNENIDLGTALDLFVYGEADGVGDLILDIGKIYNHTTLIDDIDVLYLLFYKGQESKNSQYFKNLTQDNLKKVQEDVISCRYRLERLAEVPAGVKEEILLALQEIEFAVHVATKFMIEENIEYLKDLSIESQTILAEEFEKLINSMLKNRDRQYQPGGRFEALCWLKRYWMTCCNKISFPIKF